MGSDHIFTFRHAPLSYTYCNERLRTYEGRCGVKVRCHQLRHSCATLLLNAGAPILTVQTILGHPCLPQGKCKRIDTTLSYARLYDGTVAADYYRAMGEVEARLALVEGTEKPVLTRASYWLWWMPWAAEGGGLTRPFSSAFFPCLSQRHFGED